MILYDIYSVFEYLILISIEEMKYLFYVEALILFQRAINFYSPLASFTRTKLPLSSINNLSI